MSYTAPKPPQGCLDSEATERRLNELADELERKGLEMLHSKEGIGPSRGNQLLTTAGKLRVEAGKLAIRREDRHYSNWVVDEYRKLGGKAKDPRK